jgi:hypothetical protein
MQDGKSNGNSTGQNRDPGKDIPPMGILLFIIQCLTLTQVFHTVANDLILEENSKNVCLQYDEQPLCMAPDQ